MSLLYGYGYGMGLSLLYGYGYVWDCLCGLAETIEKAVYFCMFAVWYGCWYIIVYFYFIIVNFLFDAYKAAFKLSAFE